MHVCNDTVFLVGLPSRVNISLAKYISIHVVDGLKNIHNTVTRCVSGNVICENDIIFET